MKIEKPDEDKKVDEFQTWLVERNPTVSTCLKLFKSIDNFILYRLSTIKNLEDSKNAMDAHFAEIMNKNFEERP